MDERIHANVDVRRLLHRGHLHWLLLLDMPGLFRHLQADRAYGGVLGDWLEGLAIRPGSDVLEVGCGPGIFAQRIADAGHRVTALDRSARMLAAARRQRQAKRPVEFIRASAQDTGLAGTQFDCVLAASLLNVVDDPSVVVGELARVLRSGGVLSFLQPTPAMTGDAVEAYIRAQRLPSGSAAILETWQRRARTLASMRGVELLAHAGLVDVQVNPFLGGMLAAVTATRP